MRNAELLSPAARAHHEPLCRLVEDTLHDLPDTDRRLFELRLERRFQDLFDGLEPIYGRRADFGDFLERLIGAMAHAYLARPESLRTLDIERDLMPDWFQRPSMVGYVFYVERFAGDIRGIHERLDYLEELGVRYVHLMKLLRPREGENDGGYAIVDYRSVDPALGTGDDLVALCDALRARGISVCVDIVLNHCAREHPWAEAARAGDARYLEYFHTFPDRGLPDAYERTLLEVFPDFAPGNFTFDETLGRWVWTTFHDYQWDLDWSNPEVFLEIIGVMLHLANLGVDVFRLDAVAFMWKRLGTTSQNEEEVYDILQALRACSRIATPAVAHKAEAIVSPDDLIRYFGVGHRHGKVSNIAYHNSLMVQTWSALASRDARLMAHALAEFPRTPATIAWATYLRCHDDIGWAVADDDARAVGLDPFAHRAFLSDYYSGRFPGSHARGTVFQHNPETGDRRINGSCASLAGLELALEAGDARLVDLAIERILMGHALIAGFGGLPLLYMGDEIGMLNDAGYASDPEHAGDGRWLHRPMMDWEKAARRRDPGTVEGRIFAGIRRIVGARRGTRQLHASYDTAILRTDHPRVFAYARPHPIGVFVGIYNVTESTQYLSVGSLAATGLAARPFERLDEAYLEPLDGHYVLAPYARLWLTSEP